VVSFTAASAIDKCVSTDHSFSHYYNDRKVPEVVGRPTRSGAARELPDQPCLRWLAALKSTIDPVGLTDCQLIELARGETADAKAGSIERDRRLRCERRYKIPVQ